MGLTSNRCPECGRDFDPANPRTFLAHPPRIVLRRIVKIVKVLFCLLLPLLGSYVGYLAWQVHEEAKSQENSCGPMYGGFNLLRHDAFMGKSDPSRPLCQAMGTGRGG